MNEYSYSKIKGGFGTEIMSSRSMDSSDLLPLPQTCKASSNIPTPNPSEIFNQSIIKNSNPNNQDSSEQEDDDDDDVQEGNKGEMFGPKLRRNSSVSSAYAFQLQAAVKRAFSMRRSSSVSERYCRIHDQFVTLASPLDDEELDITGTRTSLKKKKKKNRRGKILKAWKKLFGL